MSEANSTNTTAVSVSDRGTFVLRQAGLLALALLVAGLITQRLEPVSEGASRGIVSTQFLWAIAVWVAVLVFQAVAFEQRHVSQLQGWPLLGGLGIGAVIALSGLIGIDGASIGRRLVFAIATGLGAVMFWWATFSLLSLIVSWLRSGSS